MGKNNIVCDSLEGAPDLDEFDAYLSGQTISERLGAETTVKQIIVALVFVAAGGLVALLYFFEVGGYSKDLAYVRHGVQLRLSTSLCCGPDGQMPCVKRVLNQCM